MKNKMNQCYSQSPTKLTRVPQGFLGISVSGVSDRLLDGHSGTFNRIYSSSSIGYYEQFINHYSCRCENNDNNHDNPYHAMDFLLRKTGELKSMYWLCNGINRTFTLLRLWDLFEENVLTFPVQTTIETPTGTLKHGVRGFLSLGDKSEICIFKYKDTTVRAVSYSNYGDMSIEECLRFAGYSDDANMVSNGEDSFDYPSDLVIQRSISKWFSYIALNWKQNDLGIFGLTSSQLSHNAYKRKYLSSRTVLFRKPELDRLERSSVFGGRADIWFNGDAIADDDILSEKPEWYAPSENILNVGTIYRIDISSMYPWIFSQFPVPGECISHSDNWSVYDLDSAIQEDYIVCAAVKLKSPINEYPVRIHARNVSRNEWTGKQFKNNTFSIKGSVKYPKGIFDTVLIGPELESASREKIIEKCYEMAVYKKSEEYQDYFDYLIHKRYESKILQNKNIESFWKLLANSFGGKLAQKNEGWTDANGKIDCPIPWGEYYLTDYDTGTMQKCRSLGWYAQLWSNEKYNPNSRPAVWSYVCSIGRYMMRSIREQLPKYSVLQQDTDGMYVTQEAIDRLQDLNLINHGFPGTIRIVSKHRHVRLFAPRNYFADFIPTMSGISSLHTILDGNRFVTTSESKLGRGKNNEAPSAIKTSKNIITLVCESQLSKDFIHGWAMPDHIGIQEEWKPFSLDPMADLFRNIS